MLPSHLNKQVELKKSELKQQKAINIFGGFYVQMESFRGGIFIVY